MIARLSISSRLSWVSLDPIVSLIDCLSKLSYSPCLISEAQERTKCTCNPYHRRTRFVTLPLVLPQTLNQDLELLSRLTELKLNSNVHSISALCIPNLDFLSRRSLLDLLYCNHIDPLLHPLNSTQVTRMWVQSSLRHQTDYALRPWQTFILHRRFPDDCQTMDS